MPPKTSELIRREKTLLFFSLFKPNQHIFDRYQCYNCCCSGSIMTNLSTNFEVNLSYDFKFTPKVSGSMLDNSRHYVLFFCNIKPILLTSVQTLEKRELTTRLLDVNIISNSRALIKNLNILGKWFPPSRSYLPACI